MLDRIAADIADCRQCPRLVAWREKTAQEKRAAYREVTYWGRPVPGFGDPAARLVVVGLAPAAHGANRTGRMFTGDRSGDWLYRAMFQTGFANQAASIAPDDGLRLIDAFVTSFVRCAPPANKPTTRERDACRKWLDAELDELDRVQVVMALGGLAFDQTLRVLRDRGARVPVPKPKFAHGVEVPLGGGQPILVGSYHPSQQNTFTGRLTEEMLRTVFLRAAELISGRGRP